MDYWHRGVGGSTTSRAFTASAKNRSASSADVSKPNSNGSTQRLPRNLRKATSAPQKNQHPLQALARDTFGNNLYYEV